MNKKIKEGDIFTISDAKIGNGKLSLKRKIRFGKVIFTSKITKRMIGVMISECTFNEIPSDTSKIQFMNNIFYTGDHFLKDGSWHIIGNQSVTEIEKDLTTRLVGNSLWKLDINLGLVSNSERKKYNKQLIYGLGVFYSTIDQL